MTIRNLELMLKPSSIAFIGKSGEPFSQGAAISGNLLRSGFKGKLFFVGPKDERIEAVPTYPDVAALPEAPDLAVIATAPETVPALIGELAERGTKTAVVICASPGGCNGEYRKKWHLDMLDRARSHLVRILGPNSPGLMVPGSNLNASLGHIAPIAGNLAFVAQSGAVQAAVLDWATSHKIGFSHFIGLGDMADVDFGDMLDYLAAEPATKAILLHMESIKNARKFMSAARAAARLKPVIVVKAGRSIESARAATVHTGGAAGRDEVYEAAFSRAGMLRVRSLHELFAAVETLAAAKPAKGDRLAIISNGAGLGVLTIDDLLDEGGRLAELSPETEKKLSAIIPETGYAKNPVDILDDAPCERYARALEIVIEDRSVDGILLLNAPNAAASPLDSARTIIESIKKGSLRARPPVLLTSWVGEDAAKEARSLFSENRVPTYESPTEAVRGFMHLVRYRKNQEALMETPPNIPESFSPDRQAAERIVEAALAHNRSWLSAAEAKSVLSAYAIPVVPTLIAETPEEAASFAAELHPPVALKILSADIRNKSRVCGVALHLESSRAVLETARAMIECVRSARPGARLSGFTLQPMVSLMNARELTLGALTDPCFGPAIFFGQGGTASDAIGDKAFALPPLNMHLARELMSRTRIDRILKGEGNIPPLNVDAVALTLVKISQLICDLSDVAELEINPLLADTRSVIAVDISIRVEKSADPASNRLAIRPYPKDLEETLTLPDGQSLLIRPIRPEDEPGFANLFSELSPDDIRLRFLHPMKTLPHSLAARLTQIDYDREMALVLTDTEKPGEAGACGGQKLYGGVRISGDPDNERAEFSILLRREMTGVGLGPMLMRRIIEYSRKRGIKQIFGEVLGDNRPMLRLCKAFGFSSSRDPDDPGVLTVCLNL